MDDSKRRFKNADFPKEVLSVKNALQKTNDPRLETMRLLTESRIDEFYTNDLKIMWNRLEEYSGGFGAENNELWVYGFLNTVDKIRKLPKHFYLSDEDRKDLIERIRTSTKELMNIHIAHDFSEKNIENISFIEILESMAKQTIQELEETALEGKSGKNIYAIRLIRFLARHHRLMFGEHLNSVLKTTALAIYGVEYLDSDISNLLNRS